MPPISPSKIAPIQDWHQITRLIETVLDFMDGAAVLRVGRLISLRWNAALMQWDEGEICRRIVRWTVPHLRLTHDLLDKFLPLYCERWRNAYAWKDVFPPKDVKERLISVLFVTPLYQPIGCGINVSFAAHIETVARKCIAVEIPPHSEMFTAGFPLQDQHRFCDVKLPVRAPRQGGGGLRTDVLVIVNATTFDLRSSEAPIAPEDIEPVDFATTAAPASARRHVDVMAV